MKKRKNRRSSAKDDQMSRRHGNKKDTNFTMTTKNGKYTLRKTESTTVKLWEPMSLIVHPRQKRIQLRQNPRCLRGLLIRYYMKSESHRRIVYHCFEQVQRGVENLVWIGRCRCFLYIQEHHQLKKIQRHNRFRKCGPMMSRTTTMMIWAIERFPNEGMSVDRFLLFVWQRHVVSVLQSPQQGLFVSLLLHHQCAFVPGSLIRTEGNEKKRREGEREREHTHYHNSSYM